MSAAVIGSVWAILPKISTREVVIDHVIQHDVPFDNHVPQDKPFDNYVPHDMRFDLPVPQASTPPKPVASAPPDMGPQSPYAAKTPEENKFVDKPEYNSAAYHGRIVKSTDGRALSFADGQSFSPGHWDPSTQKSVSDPNKAFDSDAYIGDLGMCVPESDHKELWECTAMHNGREVAIYHKPYHASAADGPPASGPTTSAQNMVMVDVTVGSYPVEAMVDTGCSFPMSVPKVYADALIRVGLAARTGAATSILADGSEHSVDMIVIKQIAVNDRILRGVAASVAPNDNAPILLGLGALNHLGPYSIQEGRLVFTGEQPA
jgi:hypothetical protein